MLLLGLMPLSGLAQSDFEMNGYINYMGTVVDNPLTVGMDQDHLWQARLNSAWYVSDAITAFCELRFRGYYGDSVDSVPGFRDMVRGTYDAPRLDMVIWDDSNTYGYGQVDRLVLDYYADPVQITVGRQRIAWGTTLVWNVIDIFNSGSVLDFSYEEGPGADAIRAQLYTGPVSKIEMAARLSDDKYEQTLAGLWNVNLGSYDWYLILSKDDNRLSFGGAWAGSVADAGFRGEFRVSEAPSKGKPSIYPGNPYYVSDDNMFSLALSADYTFENSFYIHSETLFNSNGKTDNAGDYTYQALEAGLLSPSRLSFFQEFSYNLTPLWRTSLFAIINMDDQSWILVPNVTWSARDNLDMTLTGYLADGTATSEWGVINNTLVWRMKYSF